MSKQWTCPYCRCELLTELTFVHYVSTLINAAINSIDIRNDAVSGFVFNNCSAINLTQYGRTKPYKYLTEDMF